MVYSVRGYTMSELVSLNGCTRRRQTHCKNGHLYDEKTSFWKVNWKGYKCRQCRECARLLAIRQRLDPARQQSDRERTALWRKRHPEDYKRQYQAEFEKRRQILLEARAGGCIKCGEKDPACLDFHHRDPTTKEGHIGEFRKFGMKRLLAEIEKCDVLCANCHRKFHRDERQHVTVSEGV